MDRRGETPDRRSGEGLVLDAAPGRLRLGRASVELPPGAANRQVLEAYVELVHGCRGDRPSQLHQVRDADLVALAHALDLDAGDLVAEIEAVLGADGAAARRLLARFRDHRVVTGIAAVALTATITGTVVAAGVGSAGPTADRTAPVSAAPATVLAPPTSVDVDPTAEAAITTTPEGVGLVPARTESADGVGLVPAESVDRQH